MSHETTGDVRPAHGQHARVDLGELAEAVAVVGMDGRFPGATDLEQFHANLFAGVESITVFNTDELAAAGVPSELAADPDYVAAAGVLDDVEHFDARFFGISPRDAELLDPQHRLYLQCAWRALEDAACDPDRFIGRIGVFAGAGLPSYLLRHIDPGRGGRDDVVAYHAVLANDKDFLATRVSYHLDLRGPSITVQTACSTSLVAVCQACQSLAAGDCDAALAGGVSLRLPQRAGYLYQQDGILSPDGHCRAFDAAARGTVPGSGVGVVALRRLDDALADGDPVRAVLRGWAVNNDGAAKVGYTAPGVEGQAEAIAEALALAGVAPETVTYVEAHGTGTAVGDPIELAALGRAFGAAGGPGSCAVGSVKTNVGHLDAAAGVAGLIKTVLALETGQLPASLHFERPHPEIDFAAGPFRICQEASPWPISGHPRRAGVSSFGIGGTNAHVVLEQAPTAGDHPEANNDTQADDAEQPALLLLSARTESALATVAANLSRHLEASPDLPLDRVAYTLHAGRRPLEHRRFALCRHAQAAAILEAEAAPPGGLGYCPPGHRPVAFLFPGQGSQYPGMAADLYRHGGTFRRQLDRCAELLAPELELPTGVDFQQAIFNHDPRAASRLRATTLAQPALFAVAWALARQWMAWGVRPQALAGHSVGELVAACLAGVFTVEDALVLVAARGRLLHAMPPGAMLAVPLAEAEVEPLLGSQLALAAVNGPRQCTVSGPEIAITALEARLAAEHRPGRRLETAHAFHSREVETLLPEFRRLVAALPRRPPKIPMLSNVTGTWLGADEATDAGYWVRHLRRPVRFAAQAAELLAEPSRVLLEVGPGETLATLVRQQPSAAGRTMVSSLPHPQEQATARETLLAAAGRLWLAGVEIDPSTFHPPAARRKVRLPAYPFEGERHWIDPPAPAVRRADSETRDRPDATPAAGDPADAAPKRRPDPADWLYVPTWKRGQPVIPESAPNTAWLLLVDCLGVGAALARILEDRGDTVVTVGVGGDQPNRPQPDLTTVIDALPAEGPLRAVHLGAVAAGEGTERSPALELVRLATALSRRFPGREIPLAMVTDGLQEVIGGELYDPARAAVVGFGRVVPQELPGVFWRWIDLEPRPAATDLPTLAERLLTELGAPPMEPPVALRGAHRWQQIFEPATTTTDEDRPMPAPIEPGEHWLITGGLGRFGLTLARHLGTRHGARLTLIDHRPETTADEARADTFAAIAAAGGETAVAAVDVADLPAVVAALGQARERWGPPVAVIHAAGAPAEVFTSLTATGSAELAAHLRPKLDGARALAAAFGEVLADAPPRHCLAISSLAPWLGGVGLASFAAADAVLAAFVQAAGPPWRVVDWEGWGGLGDEAAVLPGLAGNQWLLDADDLVASFERCLGVDATPRLVISTGDLPARLDAWQRSASAAAVAPGLSAHRRDTGVPYRAPSRATETRIAEVWGEVLGVVRIGIDDDFFLLGGSSLAGLQILSMLRLELGVELPLRSFFEARTVAAMATAVDAELSSQPVAVEQLEEMLAAIETMNDEEVARQLLAAEDGS